MAKQKHEKVFKFTDVTAMILDNNRTHVVKIKHYLTPNIFLHEIAGRTYMFALPHGENVYTLTMTGAFAAKFVMYDIRGYQPLTDDTIEAITGHLNSMVTDEDIPFGSLIKDVLKKTKKVNQTTNALYKSIQRHGGGDKLQPDVVQDIEDLLVEILHDDEVVTPVRRLSQSLENDIRRTTPSFLGDCTQLGSNYANTLPTLTNSKPKNMNTMMIVLICIIGVSMMGAIYLFAAGEGGGIPGLDSIIPGIDRASPTTASTATISGDRCSPDNIQAQYNDGLLAAVAIIKGELPCDPNNIEGKIGEIVRSQMELAQWVVDNEGSGGGGGGPLDVIPETVPDVIPELELMP